MSKNRIAHWNYDYIGSAAYAQAQSGPCPQLMKSWAGHMGWA